jgi:catechol 2,3-dioxygenase-like lactoylglutathione lyase family enzyme
MGCFPRECRGGRHGVALFCYTTGGVASGGRYVFRFLPSDFPFLFFRGTNMSIFTHVCLGALDLPASKKFYDAALGALDIGCIGPFGERAWMYGKGAPEFLVLLPANGGVATFANGGTLGFAATTRAQVRAFHEAGLANGGTDEGVPGPRSFTPTAYAAYLRDPAGNKLCAYCFADGE